MNKVFIALDFETTGLSPYEDGIIEIGAVKFDETGSVIDTFESFANPQVRISAGAKKVHGISERDLEGAPPPMQVWQSLLDWASDDYVAFVAHNAGFEIGFLRSLYDGETLMPDFKFIDTLALSRRRRPELPSHSLVNLVPELGDSSHRALADAKACAQLVLQIAETYKSGKLPDTAIKSTSGYETVDDKPTRNQLGYIEDLGGNPRKPKTKAEASDYIDRLKSGERDSGNFSTRKVFWGLVILGILWLIFS